MKHVFKQQGRVRKTVMRDAHDPTRVYIKTETNERPVVDRNQRIRSAELLPQDSPNPLSPLDGDVVAFAFQFPTMMDYVLAKAQEPDLFEQCELGGDEGLAAGQKLALLFPQYVTTTKRGDARRRNH